MTPTFLPIEIPEAERTPLVNWLLNLIVQQQQVISNQQEIITKLEEKVTHLEEKVGSLDSQSHCSQETEGETENSTKHSQPRGKQAPERGKTTWFRQTQPS